MGATAPTAVVCFDVITGRIARNRPVRAAYAAGIARGAGRAAERQAGARRQPSGNAGMMKI